MSISNPVIKKISHYKIIIDFYLTLGICSHQYLHEEYIENTFKFLQYSSHFTYNACHKAHRIYNIYETRKINLDYIRIKTTIEKNLFKITSKQDS